MHLLDCVPWVFVDYFAQARKHIYFLFYLFYYSIGNSFANTHTQVLNIKEKKISNLKDTNKVSRKKIKKRIHYSENFDFFLLLSFLRAFLHLDRPIKFHRADWWEYPLWGDKNTPRKPLWRLQPLIATSHIKVLTFHQLFFASSNGSHQQSRNCQARVCLYWTGFRGKEHER